MLGEIFKALFITSLAGFALAAVISLLRPITKKVFGYSWHCYIWLCVLFVMILPVRFNVKAPIVPSISTQTVQTEQAVIDEKPQTAENIVQADTVQQPRVLQKATVIWDRIMYNRMNILAYLWLIGAVVLLLIYIIGYIRLICKMHKNSVVVSCPELTKFTDKRVTVRAWENTSTPFMVGVFKPTLVLPSGELTEEQLDNIIRHEMTHFKRHDILYKWFAELVKCVHWFNPVIWYVSKQINTECEISCDMAVTKNMSGTEEMSYINTILSLLPKDKASRLSFTTQMASSKKVLKRRFTMIKNKKTTSRFMSVLSAVIAVIMLSTTVFASGIIQNNFTGNNIKYEVYNGDNIITLKSEPFIYDSEYFLPLRDILNGFGITDITYNNGEITVKFPKEKAIGETNVMTLKLGEKLIHYGEPKPAGYGVVQRCAPVLHNDVTFVTVDYFEDIMRIVDLRGFRLNVIRPTEPESYYEKGEKVFVGTAEEQDNYTGETVKRIIIDEKGETIAVIPVENQIPENIEQKLNRTEIANTYESFYQAFYEQATGYYDIDDKLNMKSVLSIIEKEDKSIAYIGIADIIRIPQNEFNKDFRMTITNTYTSKNNQYAVNTPEYTIDQFFYSFGTGDFENMKRYCTQNCTNTFFNDDAVFGMKKANLTEMNINPLEYAKSSNGFNVFVSVNMTPSEESVFDPSETSTSFYVILQRQTDGRYLIDEFATGL